MKRHADELVQDAILWIHILLMMLSFGIIFPTGMVLGVRLSLRRETRAFLKFEAVG